MTDVSQYEDLNSLSTNRLHCAISVPTSETAFTLGLSANGKLFYTEYTLDTSIKKTETLVTGGEVDIEDYAKLSFMGIKYTDDLLPSNTNGVYSHDAIDNADNTYLIAMFDLTNYQATGKMQTLL